MTKPEPWTAAGKFEQLMQEGSIVIDSPKVRARLYAILREKGIKWRSDITGHDEGKTYFMSRWTGNGWWTINRVVKLIEHGRILKEDIIEAIDDRERYSGSNSIDLDLLFSTEKTFTEKVEHIKSYWGNNIDFDKWTPFDSCRVRKTTVRVSLVSVEK